MNLLEDGKAKRFDPNHREAFVHLHRRLDHQSYRIRLISTAEFPNN
jgi:hypothetical protein